MFVTKKKIEYKYKLTSTYLIFELQEFFLTSHFYQILSININIEIPEKIILNT